MALSQHGPNMGQNNMRKPQAGPEILGAVQGTAGKPGPTMPQTDAKPAPAMLPTQGAGKSQLFSALKPTQLNQVYKKD